MAWFVGSEDVVRLFAEGHVSLVECIDAVEASFREHGRGQVGILPRQILTADGAAPHPRSRALKLSASYMRDSKAMGASIYSTHYTPGEVDMWIMVFSGQSGEVEGILHGKALSLWKTGATAAVAARHMARRDAARAALIGTGAYAKAQLQCLSAVRELTHVTCYSRDQGRLDDFVAWASGAMPGTQVSAAASAREAVERADIVATITTSPAPVVEGAWLSPGTHCNAMGQHSPSTRELDSNAIIRARLVVDAREQAFSEKGEIMIPLLAGEIDAAHVVGELGEVVAGSVAGRTRDDEVTVFCSGGTALEYMNLCRLLVERARDARLGLRLD